MWCGDKGRDSGVGLISRVLTRAGLVSLSPVRLHLQRGLSGGRVSCLHTPHAPWGLHWATPQECGGPFLEAAAANAAHTSVLSAGLPEETQLLTTSLEREGLAAGSIFWNEQCLVGLKEPKERKAGPPQEEAPAEVQAQGEGNLVSSALALPEAHSASDGVLVIPDNVPLGWEQSLPRIPTASPPQPPQAT